MKQVYKGLLTVIGIMGFSSLSWGQCFNPAVSYGVGISPYSIVTSDFNGDKKLDLVTASTVGNTGISVLLGNGNGTFNIATNFSVEGNIRAVAVGDFNKDGSVDLVTANDNDLAQTVSILLGNGTGQFSAPTSFSVNGYPSALVVGDFDSDGKLDLATTLSNSVAVLRGDGNGKFGTQVSYEVGFRPGSLVTGDFNADSKLDLAIANSTSGTVSILLNNGTGGFGPTTDFKAGRNPTSVAIGDFNNDGKLDLITANTGSYSPYATELYTGSVLLGDGSGQFGSPVEFIVGKNPSSVVVSDFNTDGKLDVAVANSGYRVNTISVRLGNGSGGFSPALDLNVNSPNSLVIGDFNADNKPDLASANYSSDENTSTVAVLLNCVTTGLTFTPPAYDCTTGQLTLTTTGGNGQPIEYRVAGLRDWAPSNTFTVPAYQRSGTSFTLEARQSGGMTSLPFTATCQPTTPVTPPTPPTTPGSLSLVTPAYDCTTGQLLLGTTGGNGSPVEYRVAGLRDWASSNAFSVPTYQRTNTSFTLEARQNGTMVSLPFTASCQITPTPPANIALSVAAQPLNCQTGALQLTTTGGDGTPIDYKVPGLRDWDASNTFTVPTYQRNGTTFTVYARQGGREVTSTYTSACLTGGRVASAETVSNFDAMVYPNPVGEQLTVRVSGAAGQAVRYQLTNLQGQTVVEQQSKAGSDVHSETLKLPASGSGVYLLRVSTDGQSETLKVLKP